MNPRYVPFEKDREALDAMNLPGLSALFDQRCNEARQRGLWLYEFEPEFCHYCLHRLPWLARAGAGVHRQ